MSAESETQFTLKNNELHIIGEYPQYTRPEVFTYTDENGEIKSLKVPDILKSGHHQKIAEENKQKRATKRIEFS